MFAGNAASLPLTTLAAGLDCKAERAFAPSRLARLMARVRSRGLDRKLIAGADPGASPVLAARAGQLTQRSTRARLANQHRRSRQRSRRPAGPTDRSVRESVP